jgi:hypothetical protein
MTLGPVRREGLGARRAVEQLVACRRSQKRDETDGGRHPLRSGATAGRPAFNGILRDAREPGEFAGGYSGGAQFCPQHVPCFGTRLGRSRRIASRPQGREASLYGVEHFQHC